MKIVLIPCVPCDWRTKGRILGRTQLPPPENAAVLAMRLAEQLRPVGPLKIFHSPDELAATTAKALGKILNVPVKASDALVEVDMGLWAGLTQDQLRTRFASAYHQLEESPLNVNPPDGEDFREAADRLSDGFQKLAKRAGEGPIAVVVRPIALALLRSRLNGQAISSVWETASQQCDPVIIDTAK